jgi:hypothetical protein
MIGGPRTSAEETEIRLQDGARSGSPIMIPGALEVGVGRATVPSRGGAPDIAPGVATAVRRRTILERIWRYVMRPTDTPPL